MDSKLRKVIVTGGAGYIGTHTVVALIEKGYLPIIVDDFSNSTKKIIHQLEEITKQKIVFYDIDCKNEQNLSEIFKKEKEIFGVIHFAAYKAVGESVEKPTMYYQNNIGSLISVIKVMKNHNVKNIVFSSSCTVYGEPDKLPVTEKSPIKKASSPYGYTKQVCEELLQNETQINQINSIILRYFNPIGAHPSGLIGELPIGIPNNLIPFITKVANKELDQLTVFGKDYNTEDGTCIRDYIHVMDLASAHVNALDYIAKTDIKIDIFNIGVGKGNSVLDCIKSFEKATNIEIPFQFGKKRAGDVEKIFADNKKAITVLNWKASRTFEEAMKDVWRWQQTLNTLNIKIDD